MTISNWSIWSDVVTDMWLSQRIEWRWMALALKD